MTPAQLTEANNIYGQWMQAKACHKAVMDHLKAHVDTPVAKVGVQVSLRPLLPGRSDQAYQIFGEPGRTALVAMGNCLDAKVAEYVAALAALGVTVE